MLSPKAFFRKLGAAQLSSIAEAAGWELGSGIETTLPNKEYLNTWLDEFAKIEDQSVAQSILEICEECDRVAKGGTYSVLLPACGDDVSLEHHMASLPSDEARAVFLYFYNKSEAEDSLVFKRARALFETGAHRPRGTSWNQHTIKSRKAVPTGLSPFLESALKIISAEISKPESGVPALLYEAFSRPAIHGLTAGPKTHCLSFEFPGHMITDVRWKNNEQSVESGNSNCRVVFCLTPENRILETGFSDVSPALVEDFRMKVIRNLLGPDCDIQPVEPRRYSLESLSERKRFPSVDEHRISSVRVTRLSFISGRGVCTHYVAAKSKSDVYDTRKHPFPGKLITGATLRVKFEKSDFVSRATAVTFNIKLPNACDLREAKETERLLVQKYLTEWELVDTEAETPSAISVRPTSTPLGDLLSDRRAELTSWELETLIGADLVKLEEAGAILRISSDSHANCTRCGERIEQASDELFPKELDVCPSCGGVPSESAIPAGTYQFDASGLAYLLTVLIDLDPESSGWLEEGRLIKLGRDRQNDWEVWLTVLDWRSSDIDSLIPVLRRLRPAVTKTILLAPYVFPEAIKLPTGFVSVAVDELIEFHGGNMDLNRQRLAIALDRNKPPRPPGRRSAKKIAQGCALVRRRFRVRDPEDRAEVEAILSMVSQLRPDAEIPEYEQVRYVWLKEHFS